jgi:antitoxin component of MazEF toxin-antitoxin module
MVSKLLKTEQGWVVLLPENTLEVLGLTPDTEVSVALRPDLQQIVITPADLPWQDVDEVFAQQLADFIEQYRPALEALAK